MCNFGFIGVCLLFFGQVYAHKHIIAHDTTHNPLLFIDLKKNCSFWYGVAGVPPKHHYIFAECQSRENGWVRIIFYPKNVKQVTTLDSLNKISFKQKNNDTWARNYILSNNHIAAFEKWAIFVDKKYDKLLPDGDGQTIFAPVYPCKAELYKEVNSKWVFIKSATILKDDGSLFKMFPK